MRIIYLLLAACICAILAGCTEPSNMLEEPQPTAEYRRITSSRALAMMETEDDVIILDVRTAAEFGESHIEGALLIPVNDLERLAPELLPDKEQIILVYCRSGQRSANAARALLNMGYTAVYDFGGIIHWPYGTVN